MTNEEKLRKIAKIWYKEILLKTTRGRLIEENILK